MTGKLARLWATKTKDDEWWSSFVTSPLAIGVNYFAVDRKWLTPNRITLLSFAIAIAAALCIVLGGTFYFVAAAILIQISHVLDCMDGQMARYRKTSSAVGSYFDRLTDQIQVIIWFGAAGYAASELSSDIVPLGLAFIGVAFYSLRGYAKYVAIQTEMSLDSTYLTNLSTTKRPAETAGLAFSFTQNLRWLLAEQRKVLMFNEGVFVFMLSFSLVLNLLTPMLWVFAASQVFLGLSRVYQHGRALDKDRKLPIRK